MASKWKDAKTYKGSQGFTTTITYDYTKLKDIYKNMNVLNNRHVKVGWISKRKHKGSGLYLAQLARIQEYGASTNDGKSIPARPYFRQSLPQIWKALKVNSKDVFLNALNGKSIDSNLDKVGYGSKIAFQRSVMKQNMKRLAEYTVSKKGHAFQWDETGELLHNFDYKVFKSSLTKAEKQKSSS